MTTHALGRGWTVAWLSLAGLVLGASAATADDHKVAVNVRVAPGLKLDDSDLSRFVRGQLGRYEGVVALPEAKTRDAIAEERATTNSKCRSGVLDQKCQLALGSALAASHWLEVTVTRPGKKCEVSLEYLSIVRESSDGGDVVAVECDRESVAAGLERGMQTVARKARWMGAPSLAAPQPTPSRPTEPDAAGAHAPGKDKAEPPRPEAPAAGGPDVSQPTPASEMVDVPEGEFIAGDDERDTFDNTSPRQRLPVLAFQIDRTEVTVAAYRACVRAGRCAAPGMEASCNWGSGREDHPVNCVDGAQAAAFCAWKGKRLPTRREWEKAARGTDGRAYSWGDADVSTGRYANLKGGDDGWQQTSPVGSFPAGRSPYGADDMVGNVAEWCSGTDSGGKYTARGSSWATEARRARLAVWSVFTYGGPSADLGFRCARSVE